MNLASGKNEMPPVMILCGGQGTRLRDVTELLPKPMVPIGEQPIVWHIMRSFAAFGCRRFILCLGYKRECFIDYFMNFRARRSDVTLTLGSPEVRYHDEFPEADWQVTLADTGIESFTGTRVRLASRYLKPEDDCFFLTYGDGVADIDVAALLAAHKRDTGAFLTVSAVHPEGRFGEISFDGERILSFAEKPARVDGYINGGFMVMRREFLSCYLNGAENCFLEQEPMHRAMTDGRVGAFRHEGFWQCMDTPREYRLLNDLWARQSAPWTKYWE